MSRSITPYYQAKCRQDQNHQSIRADVFTILLGWQHEASDACDTVIDGIASKADPHRATGIHANAAMPVDQVLRNVGLSGLVGGSAVILWHQNENRESVTNPRAGTLPVPAHYFRFYPELTRSFGVFFNSLKCSPTGSSFR